MSVEDLAWEVDRQRQALERWFDNEVGRIQSFKQDSIKDCEDLARRLRNRKEVTRFQPLPNVPLIPPDPVVPTSPPITREHHETGEASLSGLGSFRDRATEVLTEASEVRKRRQSQLLRPEETMMVPMPQIPHASSRSSTIPLPLLFDEERMGRQHSRHPKGKEFLQQALEHRNQDEHCFVHGPRFRILCSTVILGNTIFMGVATDEMLVSSIQGTPENPALEALESCFCIFFLVEILLRLGTERNHFFKSKDVWWNAFDAFLVGLSIMDVALSLSQAGHTMNVTFARTLRVIRFVRILRIVRVMRFFYSFRLMMYSVLYSMMSLVWVFAMLAFVMYFFSMFFMHGISEHFRTFQEDAGGSPCETAICQDLIMFCGDAATTLLSLFMAICGGIDWRELWQALRGVNWMYGWFFVFFIFFMVFGVMNIVAATFVESASLISRRDRELVTHNELEKNRRYYEDIKRFFDEADTNKSGTLSWEEFDNYLQDENVQAYFQSFQLDVTQAKTLFRLLDIDESNEINLEEFVEGCMRMRGQARSIDVHMLLYESEQMIVRQAEFMQHVEEKLEEMQDQR